MIEAKDKHYFETSGYSMWPFLRQQDRIIVEQVGVADLTSGNLVVYRSNGQPICHRLVKKKISEGKWMLFTRGDYVRSWKTERVGQAQFTGRVSAIVRGERIIPLNGIRNAVCARLIILIFPIVAWIVYTAGRILKKR